jgi:predicted DNA-binding transcriptional regulator AlpA
MSPRRTPNCLLRAREVAARVGLHPKTFYRYLREGRLKGFPEARQATSTWRWLESEVEAWLESRPRASKSRRRGAATGMVAAR